MGSIGKCVELGFVLLSAIVSLSVYDESAFVPIWSSWSRQRRGRIALPTLSDGGTESIYLYIPKLFLYIVKIARDKHISECKPPPPPPPSTRFGWSRTSRKKREKEKKIQIYIYIKGKEGRCFTIVRLTRPREFWPGSALSGSTLHVEWLPWGKAVPAGSSPFPSVSLFFFPCIYYSLSVHGWSVRVCLGVYGRKGEEESSSFSFFRRSPF